MNMTTHEVVVGDSRNLQSIPTGSVQLIITSPPYPMISMWDEMFSLQNPEIKKNLDDRNGIAAFLKMHEILNEVWKECDRVLADNGFVCINIGDATRTVGENFQLYSNHTQVINQFLSMGYSVLPDIHWRKQSNAPNKFMGSGMYPAGAYVTYEHEYILIFRKGGKRVFSDEERERRKKSAYFWEERNVWFSDLWEIRGTSQIIKDSNVGRSRNASYPIEIPYRLINMYSIEGDTVLDPFAGMATTSLACMVSNRNSICVEIEPTIANLALRNMMITPQKLNQIIEHRLASHVAFIEGLPLEKKERCRENAFHGFKVKTKDEMLIKIDKILEVVQDGNIVRCTYE